MPFYNYECINCGHTAEEMHSMSTKLDTCPKCGQKTYKKLISAPSGFKFVGDGFYCNDHPKGQ